MDIWEANVVSTAYTPHVCTVDGQTRCSGEDCGDNASGDRYHGVCDKDGCDSNPFRLGNKTFYGCVLLTSMHAHRNGQHTHAQVRLGVPA